MKYKILILTILCSYQLSIATEIPTTNSELQAKIIQKFLDVSSWVNEHRMVTAGSIVGTILYLNFIAFLYSNKYAFKNNLSQGPTHKINISSPFGLLARWAITNKHNSILKMLLSVGINPEYRDTSCYHLLEIAIQSNNPEAAKILLSYGADIVATIEPSHHYGHVHVIYYNFSQNPRKVNINPHYKPSKTEQFFDYVLWPQIEIKDWFIPKYVQEYFIYLPFLTLQKSCFARENKIPPYQANETWFKMIQQFLYDNELYTDDVINRMKQYNNGHTQDSIQYIPKIVLGTDDFEEQKNIVLQNQLDNNQKRILDGFFYDKELLGKEDFKADERFKDDPDYHFIDPYKYFGSELYMSLINKQIKNSQ